MTALNFCFDEKPLKTILEDSRASLKFVVPDRGSNYLCFCHFIDLW